MNAGQIQAAAHPGPATMRVRQQRRGRDGKQCQRRGNIGIPRHAGFLAGYSGLTRQAYELDLRQYASWCQQHQLRLFQARRADIECFARDLEARGRARATITRRLCTIAGFYRYAVEEETSRSLT